jgi:hypothetical protein
MNLASEKINLAKLVLELKSEALIKQLKDVIASYHTDLWDELTTDQKRSVTRARQQVKNGEFKTHKEVMKKYKKWLTK